MKQVAKLVKNIDPITLTLLIVASALTVWKFYPKKEGFMNGGCGCA